MPVHPLLTDELLNIKTPIGAEIVGTANPRRKDTHEHDGVPGSAGGLGGEHGDDGHGDAGEHSDEITESFGTLAIGEGNSGKSRFFGLAAGASFILAVSYCFSPPRPAPRHRIFPALHLINDLPPRYRAMKTIRKTAIPRQTIRTRPTLKPPIRTIINRLSQRVLRIWHARTHSRRWVKIGRQRGSSLGVSYRTHIMRGA